jgi:hypothetical protein
MAMVIAGAAGYAFFYFKKRSKKMRETLDRMILKLPIIGPILNKAAIARYARTLSTMFAAGVPLVEALDIGGRRHRQHRLRERGAAHARRGRHRPAPAAAMETPAVPEHGDPDGRGRRRIRLARRDVVKVATSTRPTSTTRSTA